MRICVITVYNSSNCGSILQAYAMKRLLEQKGHEVCFLKTRSDKYVRDLYYSNRLLVRSIIKYPLWGITRYLYGRKKYKLYCTKELGFQEVGSIEDANADFFIIGSDEVWNVKSSFANYGYFFGENIPNALAVSVSAGTAELKDFDKFPQYRKAIYNLKAILVRDSNTKKIAEAITGKSVEKILDPTLMCEENFFMPSTDEYVNTHDCLCIYAYTIPKVVRSYIKKYANEHNIKIVSVGFWHSWVDHNCQCSPLEMPNILKKARLVITTTFHGLIYAIKQHTNFIVTYEDEMSPKVDDLIKSTQTEERFFDWKKDDYQLFQTFFSRNVNYSNTDILVESLREKSLSEFERALECIDI